VAVLLDVESIAQSLRDYVEESSKLAGSELDGLLTAITRAVSGFDEEIALLRQLLPSGLSTGLARKVAWAFDKKKVKEATQRLENLKTTLLVALYVVGRYV